MASRTLAIAVAWACCPELGASYACTIGLTIPNSDRSASSPCRGSEGDQCSYNCDPGYLAVGRHVCQSYSTMGHTVIDQSFFGGRCERLCSQIECVNGTIPVRMNSSDTSGSPCLETTCLTLEESLRRLARGNYEIFRRGRNDETGVYLDHVYPTLPKENQDFDRVPVDAAGVGVPMECVAHALGFIPLQEAQERVLLTFRALSGRLPGFRLARNPRGWLPTFVNSHTGATLSVDGFATASTGIVGVGLLFGKTYFEHVDPGSALTAQISMLGKELHEMVQWDSLVCDNGKVDGTGVGIPWLLDNSSGCSLLSLMTPDADGFYEFNVQMWVTWLAYHSACGGQPKGQCTNKPVEKMWDAWQGRRKSPNKKYEGQSLLTLGPSYILQFLYYMVHPFNSDPVYQEHFKNQWQAEWAYANSSAYYAGDAGRYGLAAGPTAQWCSGATYRADSIVPNNQQTCRMYSSNAVVGYLPANPSVIHSHIIELLASGESVLPVSGTQFYVLWRKSLLDPSWAFTNNMITLVDVAAELFGLSTLWLDPQFYSNHTNHWPSDEAAEPTVFV